MFKPRLIRIPRASLSRPRQVIPRRSLMSVHPLPYAQTDRNEKGIPGLFTPEGFNLGWTEYQTFVVNKLQSLIAGTPLEQLSSEQILKRTAREPSLAPVFNYASMAHNNNLFFSLLDPDRPTNPETGMVVPSQMPLLLKTQLERHFSSIETLRREMIITASSMFGPGFVWLVKEAQANRFKVLATYLAGTPYTEAHWRRQGVDMNNYGLNSDAGVAVATEQRDREALSKGAANGTEWVNKPSQGRTTQLAGSNRAPGAVDVIPLLCVNTWEHVWLRDYGWGLGGYGGKMAYLENWWNVVNWDRVNAAANPISSGLMQ